MRHLGLQDWELVDLGGELDLIGPVAARSLRRHGLLWPANSHLHTPLLERAGTGSLLTGVDGDTVLGGWPWARVAEVLRGRVRAEPRDVVRLAHACAPRRLRRLVDLRRNSHRPAADWLRPGERDSYARAVYEDHEEPLRWNARVNALARRRYLAVACAGLEALASDTGTLLVHPFLDRGFLSALARAGGRWGWGDRTATMTAVFGDVLPREIVMRTSKAAFDEVVWSEPSREFARQWDGSGVDETLVDPNALRDEWLKDCPHFGTACLLQSAWLYAQQQADSEPATPSSVSTTGEQPH